MMYYQEAIKADPTYARAYSNLGYALNRLGPYEKSIEITTKGLEVASDAVDFHRLYDTRGFARSNLKMYKEAIEDFTNAIKNNANNPRVYYHRAESLVLAETYDPAYADVLQALRLNDDYVPALRLKQRLEALGVVKPFRRAAY